MRGNGGAGAERVEGVDGVGGERRVGKLQNLHRRSVRSKARLLETKLACFAKQSPIRSSRICGVELQSM